MTRFSVQFRTVPSLSPLAFQSPSLIPGRCGLHFSGLLSLVSGWLEIASQAVAPALAALVVFDCAEGVEARDKNRDSPQGPNIVLRNL